MSLRLLAPALPFALLALAGVAAFFWERRRGSQLYKSLIVLLFTAIAVISISTQLNTAANYRVSGAGGYANSRWQSSEILEALETGVISDHPLSNDPNAIYLFSKIPSYYWPVKGQPLDTAELRRRTFVHFPNVKRDYLLPFDSLKKLLPLKPVAIYEDGAIYRVQE